MHRHINPTGWTLMAIESLFDRGTLADWREFARALRGDAALAQRALKVCAYREADGAEGIALALLGRLHPAMCTRRPPCPPDEPRPAPCERGQG